MSSSSEFDRFLAQNQANRNKRASDSDAKFANSLQKKLKGFESDSGASEDYPSVKVICKNASGAEICAFSPHSKNCAMCALSWTRRNMCPLVDTLELSQFELRTPHGEVQQMLAASGRECVIDVLTEAAKRVGFGQVTRYHFNRDRGPYYRGLGYHDLQINCAFSHKDQHKGDYYEPIVPLLEDDGTRPRARFFEKRGQAFATIAAAGYEMTYENSLYGDAQLVSARLVVRGVRIFLMFILREIRTINIMDSDSEDDDPERGEHEVCIEPDEEGMPKGCLPLRENDSASGEICGLKLEPHLLHDTDTDGPLRAPPDGLKPWEFVFVRKTRAAAMWSAIQRACSLLHEIDSDPTRLLGQSPNYQKITPGLILSAAFAPDRIKFVLDRGNSDAEASASHDDGTRPPGDGSAALGLADTFAKLFPTVDSFAYRELHQIKEKNFLEYHLYVMVDLTRGPQHLPSGRSTFRAGGAPSERA